MSELTKMQQQYRKHREKRLAESKAYGKQNRDKTNVNSQRYKAQNKEKAKEQNKFYWLERKYKITKEQYEQLLVLQNNACAICRSLFDFNMNENGKATAKCPCVDHDHDTGEVRALLCGHCNKGLGQFRDNINYLQNAIKYLEAFNG